MPLKPRSGHPPADGVFRSKILCPLEQTIDSIPDDVVEILNRARGAFFARVDAASPAGGPEAGD